MALQDFFRINMPYLIVKNSKGEWTAFNREYVPLGWNNKFKGESIDNDDCYSDIPIWTNYINAKETILKKLIDNESQVEYDSKGKLNKIFLYGDATNPLNDGRYWSTYLKKIKILSQLRTF